MDRSNLHIRDGVIAGLLAAAAIAAWFFVLDLMAGAPLRSLGALGAAIGGAADPASAGIGLMLMAVLLHVAASVAVGIAAAILFAGAGFRPHWLFGVPAGFLFFNLIFYIGRMVLGSDLAQSLGFVSALGASVLGGIAMFGWLQYRAPGEATSLWRELPHSETLKQGLVAGAIGAAVVAIWFLVLDVAQGRLFFTPAALGSALLLRAGGVEEVQVTAGVIAAFTVVHLVAFAVIGIVAAAFARGIRSNPPLLLGAVLLFVTLQAFIAGLVAIAAAWVAAELTWWALIIANVLAAVSMGAYLWRSNPEVRRAAATPDLEEEQYGPPSTTPSPARGRP
jgi:hypothetical protein